MPVSFLEYRSNSYCNECFEDRAGVLKSEDTCFDTFHFMGESFSLTNDDNLASSSINHSQR